MAQLSGTWTGTLRCESGDELPAVFKITESGNPIYEYQTRSGSREVELTFPGQAVAFVPPDGGVINVVVDSLSVSPDHIEFLISVSDEKTSWETLSQSRAAILYEAALSGSGLEVRMTVRSQTTFSQPGMVVPGEESTIACSGTLRR
ncbi:MAG TPA: hypothetical protein VF791_00855 [Pyrinomonadaceae bacterium]